ncbi:hypothetical protein JSQ81_18235 [Sporosarcina sp. Marseille-Q4063]|uniref:hypothetical protein n=1 Tax=Sporosarcina sp. Marseille-Q4063 TaxID=2810514 RepID=UPI001BAEDF70|nr:hypothetical protein [Sporosarcina sp. Marseille-Q4063]QUW21697.1 hypothetical protein JSQ81_18235 [Sporosarcina sp. Marseille-Q4063]
MAEQGVMDQTQMEDKPQRRLNPKDVLVPVGYEIDVFADGLTTPINLTFTSNGEMLVADSGITDGNGKVLKVNERRVFACCGWI